jgi:tetratricopeptide (TPR) repeat protein
MTSRPLVRLEVALSGLFALGLFAAPIWGQKSAPHNTTAALAALGGVDASEWSLPTGLQAVTHPDLFSPPEGVKDETCLPWTASAVVGSTVSVARLRVPSAAKSEFEAACTYMRKRKLSEAEQHARSAIQKYPNYVVAWVMLGKVLEALQRNEEAGEACSRANTSDPTYLPAYLCLAEFAVRDQQWDALLRWTDCMMGLSAAGDAYAHFFRAVAYYQKRKLAEAEKHALLAEAIDGKHALSGVYFLLAQVYEAEGRSDVALGQIRLCLKFSTTRQESALAKEYLTKLTNQKATN